MNRYDPGGISYPRRRDDWVRDHPLASRLLIMIVGFAVLIPIGLVVKASQGNVVRSGGLPGAAVAADPVIVSSSTSSSVPGAAAAGAAVAGTAGSVDGASAPISAPASTVAPLTTAAPSSTPATVAADEVAPSTTAKKAAPTTAARAAPATTAVKKPATTAAPAPKPTSPPTTRPAPTTTTVAPTTTTEAAAPPANTYSKAEVEAIIRSVFPAEEADEAVRIATRESNLVPTVRNWCCYGLFQIYFQMNKKTLAAIGVTSPEQLYDPTINAQAAYAIFQRNGWAPWQ